jgi:hypothetical protein
MDGRQGVCLYEKTSLNMRRVLTGICAQSVIVTCSKNLKAGVAFSVIRFSYRYFWISQSSLQYNKLTHTNNPCKQVGECKT